MIQAVITRLSQNSFLLKGWSVLLVSVLLAFAAGSSEKLILLVAFLPMLAFCGLDGYFNQPPKTTPPEASYLEAVGNVVAAGGGIAMV